MWTNTSMIILATGSQLWLQRHWSIHWFRWLVFLRWELILKQLQQLSPLHPLWTFITFISHSGHPCGGNCWAALNWVTKAGFTDVRVNPIARVNYFSNPAGVEMCVNGTRKVWEKVIVCFNHCPQLLPSGVSERNSYFGLFWHISWAKDNQGERMTFYWFIFMSWENFSKLSSQFLPLWSTGFSF